METTQAQPTIYHGQFGDFTITPADRRGVIIYRLGLFLCALSFAVGTALILVKGEQNWVLEAIVVLFGLFSLGLGISLITIHIYLRPLHRLLQLFWLLGTIATLVIAKQSPEPLVLFVYHQPLTLLGIGFTFAALTGIYFKEAFCFNRLEAKVLTVLVPMLLLGHLTRLLPANIEQGLLMGWAGLFIIFVLRKAIQSIPPDIGDKSVFIYLDKVRN
ncbi:conserved hypothetical protein [Rippkaea orientalis PCC 8801]|uniref:Integral membrane protein n=1 Tax=Rippkaea orientalis (strain PCC 8801 / RF-1) TaxID=41431 RepID=B7K510_RIPO1|nr:DUF2301 domain-containing membrane protein [Rippkaea orientalis]ACK66666.1 conserved hypothetical protein [Rippkaea orientalis PCC 8801]